MLFNSIEFAIFLPIVFLLYWFVFDYAIKRSSKQVLWQNLLIVIVSYIFYGWWNYRFLILIAITTLCSYISGIFIERCQTNKAKKLVAATNIIINLGILGVYKYYDFFVESFALMLGIESNMLLHLILPVGISFYTFQALSYSIDVYRGHINPTQNLIAFAAFLSFFPQLVAGPIERATNLLPQFLSKRDFEYNTAADGMRQILWGLFKKIVVADNCAVYVNMVFGNLEGYSGSSICLAALLFTFQIYGDFSGYSDIAIGTAKLFGIRLMQNFNTPYFSRDIAEFWRRWHISLTTWFRDYVYIPLGGSRPSIPSNIKHRQTYIKAIIIRNTFIIFLLSGFWHGANWTFIIWGGYHTLLFLPLILRGKNRRYTNIIASYSLSDGTIKKRWLPSPKESIQMLGTLSLVIFGWIIFRAENLPQFFEILTGIWNKSLFSTPSLISRYYYIPTLISIVIMLLTEWLNRDKEHGLKTLPNNKIIRIIIYYGIVLFITLFSGENETFIYFQF